MTNYRRLKNMTLKEFAEFNVKSSEWIEYEYDIEDNLYPSTEYGYTTSDGEKFYDYNYDGAIEHEIEWLKSSVDFENIISE